jgi:major vault protein
MIHGPCTYFPRVEEEVRDRQQALTIKKGQALKLQAKETFKDQKSGTVRKAGEMWLVTTPGNYRLEVEEKYMTILESYIITDKRALHLKADQNFKDCYGVKRKAGEEWLVTNDMGSTHILDIHESRVGAKTLKVLSKD